MAEIPEDAVTAALAVWSRVRIDMPDPMVLSDRQLVRNMLEAAAPAMAERYDDLLGSIWLYIGWRYVTKQLTTPQKELLADAVDRDVMRSQREDGEEPRPVAERWWRDDA